MEHRRKGGREREAKEKGDKGDGRQVSGNTGAKEAWKRKQRKNGRKEEGGDSSHV